MGLILAGILAGVLVIGITFWYLSSRNPDTFGASLLVVLALVCVISGFIAGIAEPVSGYGKPEEVSTTELVSLRDDTISEGTGRLFYVSISDITDTISDVQKEKLITQSMLFNKNVLFPIV